ncbi:MAG: M20 family metallo-hydrolase [Sphingobacteriaceae bacterium]
MQEQVLQNKTSIKQLQVDAIQLLQQLIETPSFSKEEDKTAILLENFLLDKGIPVNRHLNNIWAINKHFDTSKPSILLNSHHDTVKPNKGYTKDPFKANVENDKLFGLGSNDAGGALVSLLATFIHFYDHENLKYNLVFAASAEEEISGTNGIEALLPFLPPISFGIVGEPTLMNLAVAEKGLLVLDCVNYGVAGHAARNEGNNALYHSLDDINWFKHHQFKKVSDLLGPVKMTVTSIETDNKAHNVVPSACKFIVDVRVNECYTFEEIISEIKQHVKCEVKPRNLRMRPSSIQLDHPLILSGVSLGSKTYGSPTTSDKALMPFQTLKMGPGDSARSHTADEFIFIEEIEEGIELYIKLLEKIL